MAKKQPMDQKLEKLTKKIKASNEFCLDESKLSLKAQTLLEELSQELHLPKEVIAKIAFEAYTLFGKKKD
ncbi:hypothetical protein [Sulfurospirillum diekertiae]|uniref:Uncharacterized protein n=1 Tax=Sulfurospirillum diekertiae TaxID=1854492 RepID=A0A1Y0HJ85_9BACT|nr:hypothetical protein [Sulfurospirillum diekertiae]ARU48118.1 hypothetical protein Sdiek1_0952 [Sulfurospirillum diekertiae]ASC92961.1 hypothetical protein Sdiek2_0940 [Sulfurospirillum diekertiae]